MNQWIMILSLEKEIEGAKFVISVLYVYNISGNVLKLKLCYDWRSLNLGVEHGWGAND
jgi:hypothetical protein